MDSTVCLRCLESGHLEKQCSLISSNLTLRSCSTCGGYNHISSVHDVQDFEYRHDIIQLMGYEPFQDWFLDFEFRNWWQVNGRIRVPLYKIYPGSNGARREWKEWNKHAPSLQKDNYCISPPTYNLPPTKPEFIPKPLMLRPPPTMFSGYIDLIFSHSNQSIKTSHPNVPIKWRQNNKFISVKIELENVCQNEVMTQLEDRTVRIDVEKCNPTFKYFLQIELAHDINFLCYNISSQYLEVKLRKTFQDELDGGGSWKNLIKSN